MSDNSTSEMNKKVANGYKLQAELVSILPSIRHLGLIAAQQGFPCDPTPLGRFMRRENTSDTAEGRAMADELITIIGELIASMDRAAETLFEETQRQGSLLSTKDMEIMTLRAEVAATKTATNEALLNSITSSIRTIQATATPGLTSSVPGRRQTSDPKEKFTGREKNITLRQEQYTSFRTTLNLNHATDASLFSSDHSRIMNIMNNIGGDAHTLNQDLVDAIQANPTDPGQWPVKTSAALWQRLNGQFETLDISHEAGLKFDSCVQGKRPFQNFLAELVNLAAKCRKTDEQKVEALKKKVSQEIRDAIKNLPNPPKRDNFQAWADQCQVFYNNHQEYEHNKQHAARNQPHAAQQAQARQNNAFQFPATAPGDAMDLDAIARMKDADRARLYAQGRCFYCKKEGHQKDDCEEKRSAEARRSAHFTLRGRGRGGQRYHYTPPQTPYTPVQPYGNQPARDEHTTHRGGYLPPWLQQRARAMETEGRTGGGYIVGEVDSDASSASGSTWQKSGKE
jgi:hypothetical protein